MTPSGSAPASAGTRSVSGHIPSIVKEFVPLNRKAIAYTGLLGIEAADYIIMVLVFYVLTECVKRKRQGCQLTFYKHDTTKGLPDEKGDLKGVLKWNVVLKSGKMDISWFL